MTDDESFNVDISIFFVIFVTFFFSPLTLAEGCRPFIRGPMSACGLSYECKVTTFKLLWLAAWLEEVYLLLPSLVVALDYPESLTCLVDRRDIFDCWLYFELMVT